MTAPSGLPVCVRSWLQTGITGKRAWTRVSNPLLTGVMHSVGQGKWFPKNDRRKKKVVSRNEFSSLSKSCTYITHRSPIAFMPRSSVACWSSYHWCQQCNSAVKSRNCRGQMKSVFLLLYTVYGCLVALLLLLSQILPFCEVPGVAHCQQPGRPDVLSLWEHFMNWPRMRSLCFAGGVAWNECHIISPNTV